MRIWHPDLKNNADRRDEANRRFMEIKQAYEVLTDPDRRRRFDVHGSMSDAQPRHADSWFRRASYENGRWFFYDESGQTEADDDDGDYKDNDVDNDKEDAGGQHFHTHALALLSNVFFLVALFYINR